MGGRRNTRLGHHCIIHFISGHTCDLWLPKGWSGVDSCLEEVVDALSKLHSFFLGVVPNTF